MIETIQAVDPQPDLQPYVLCYYFISSKDPSFKSIHYSFPNTCTALSLYRNATFSFGDDFFIAKEYNHDNYGTIIQKRSQSPLRVEMHGCIDRVTILFKDFGLNHFTDMPISDIMDQTNRIFNLWPEDADYEKFLHDFWSAKERADRVHFLEAFLMKKWKPIDYLGLKEAIPLLHNFETRENIETISAKLNTSLRSFNRNFKRLIGTSPVEYRRIAQFRHSLNNKLFRAQFKRLTEIGYESNFYDQSYFNKLYKKLTGANPGLFFNSVAILGNDQLIFRYVKQ